MTEEKEAEGTVGLEGLQKLVWCVGWDKALSKMPLDLIDDSDIRNKWHEALDVLNELKEMVPSLDYKILCPHCGTDRTTGIVLPEVVNFGGELPCIDVMTPGGVIKGCGKKYKYKKRSDGYEIEQVEENIEPEGGSSVE